MKLRLHTANKADWDKEGPRNVWQKVASKSYGTLTPANIASIGGAVLAIYGLLLIVDGETVLGLALVAIGRFADLVDGVIAEYTKTKSPLGEIVDASMDKLVMAFALIVFIGIDLMPWPLIAVVALQNIANVMISVVARLRDKVIHPSRLGKLATAFSWVALILYPLGDWMRADGNEPLGVSLIFLALVSFAAYLLMGAKASLQYGYSIYSPRKQSKLK